MQEIAIPSSDTPASSDTDQSTLSQAVASETPAADVAANDGSAPSVTASDVAESIDVADMGIVEWLTVGMSLMLLFVFITSFAKWISLLRQGRRPFSESALVPVVPRRRPFWNAIDFIVFYGVVIVVSILLTSIAGAAGWIDLKQLQADAASETSTLSVPQLLISSVSMLGATIVTMGLLAIRSSAAFTHVGWRVKRQDVWLGFVAAWLILPPTMVMMGAVSALQEYSHPVLEALKPADGGSGVNFPVFAVLFFTTAIVTPIVEEFWFRGLLQGGLQRLADARTDWSQARQAEDEVIVARMSGQADPDVPDTPLLNAELPYAPPRDTELDEVEPNVQLPHASDNAATSETETPPKPILISPDQRTDWTPTAIWPVVVASLLFAVMHWGQGLAPIPLFFLSLGLGYLYRQTGSLIPSIVVHFVLNGFTMTATLLDLLK